MPHLIFRLWHSWPKDSQSEFDNRVVNKMDLREIHNTDRLQMVWNLNSDGSVG